jgi:hypothetical protein
MQTTPGFSLVGTTEAVQFNQDLRLPSQLGKMLGEAEPHKSVDLEVYSALINIQGKARESSELIGRLSLDETKTDPVKHEAGAKVAARLVTAAEGTQAMLIERASAYEASTAEIMETRFAPNEKRMYLYDRISSWIEREAKNGEGNGYRNIREAIETNSDFAMVAFNFPHQLLGLPFDHLSNFRAKAVERWAPEVTKTLLYAEKLKDLAMRYPKFITGVKSSFYNPNIAIKARTRVDV